MISDNANRFVSSGRKGFLFARLQTLFWNEPFSVTGFNIIRSSKGAHIKDVVCALD